MRHMKYIIVLSITLITALVPTFLFAETLSVLRGDISKTISISHDQTIVIQSNIPFKKATIANPYVANIVFLSNHHIEVTGLTTGRTSLSFFGPEGHVVNSVEIRVVRQTETYQSGAIVIAPEMPPETSLSVQHGRATRTAVVPLGAAVIIKSDTNFSSATLTDTTIAYIMTLSDNSVYIMGRSIGTTTLSFLRNNGTRGTNIEIKTVENLNDFK